MDPARTLLLGLLGALTACASWPTNEGPRTRLTPTDLHLANVAAPCEHGPDVRVVDDTVIVGSACDTTVVLYRRDATSDAPPIKLGLCQTPCTDASVQPDGVYAYATARVVNTSDAAPAHGPCSPETYVALE